MQVASHFTKTRRLRPCLGIRKVPCRMLCSLGRFLRTLIRLWRKARPGLRANRVLPALCTRSNLAELNSDGLPPSYPRACCKSSLLRRACRTPTFLRLACCFPSHKRSPARVSSYCKPAPHSNFRSNNEGCHEPLVACSQAGASALSYVSFHGKVCSHRSI